MTWTRYPHILRTEAKFRKLEDYVWYCKNKNIDIWKHYSKRVKQPIVLRNGSKEWSSILCCVELHYSSETSITFDIMDTDPLVTRYPKGYSTIPYEFLKPIEGIVSIQLYSQFFTSLNACFSGASCTFSPYKLEPNKHIYRISGTWEEHEGLPATIEPLKMPEMFG